MFPRLSTSMEYPSMERYLVILPKKIITVFLSLNAVKQIYTVYLFKIIIKNNNNKKPTHLLLTCNSLDNEKSTVFTLQTIFIQVALSNLTQA